MKKINAKFFGGNLSITLVSGKSKEEQKSQIDGIIERTKNAKPLMQAIGRYLLNDIDDNFKNNGRPKWKALKHATRIDRIRQGYGARNPKLQRTGRLRKSFGSRSTHRKNEVTTNSGIYEYHQKGTENTENMVARPMFRMRRKMKAEIIRMTNRWIFEGKV